MKTSIVYDFEIDKLDASCDCVIFAGELFVDGLSKASILNFQQYIESLKCIVVVFYDCCLFQIRSDRIFAHHSYMSVYFDTQTSRLHYKGQILETGVYDILDCNQHTIYVENDQIQHLPRLTGTINHIELRYRDCSQQTVDYVRNLYGRIDSCVNLNAKHTYPQFVNLISIEWTNIMCFRSGRINFNDMDEVIIIRGGNGVGKSSLLSIILYGFFGTPAKNMLRAGCDCGHITAAVEVFGIEYEISIELSKNMQRICVRSGGEIVAADHSFMPMLHAAIRDKFEYKLQNTEHMNDIFSELCGINVTARGVRGDDEIAIQSLSAGQKFMFELSYKLSQETAPQVFFIDERMDKLDAQCLERCMDMILRYRKKIMIITHRDAIMSFGRVVYIDKYRGASEIVIKK